MQKTQPESSAVEFSNDTNTISNILETKSLKRRLIFSGVNEVASSDYEMSTTPSVSVKAAKSILKKSNSSDGFLGDKP